MFAEKYITFFLGKEQLFQRSRHDQIVNRNQAENRLHSVHNEFRSYFPKKSVSFDSKTSVPAELRSSMSSNISEFDWFLNRIHKSQKNH